MSPARRLLLVPLLAPLLAVLVLAALNPAPRLSLRLLTWRSAPLPLGAWLALASSGGALISAAAVGLSLGQAGGLAWSERRRPDGGAGRASGGTSRWRQPEREPWRDAEPTPAAAPGSAPWREPSGASAGPSRAAGEPAPTVAVPFRVIQRPAHAVRSGVAANTPTAFEVGRSRPVAAPMPPQRQPVDAAPPHGGGEDWGHPPLDDW
ncbi:MAG: hypothetical protein ACKO7Z_09005 [Cyanobacteriota bacterium]